MHGTLPDFLDRKVTVVPVATTEERKAFAARTTSAAPAEEKLSLSADEKAKQEIEETLAERKKRKADVRIGKMKSRLSIKEQVRNIPEKYLTWDVRRRQFFDVRDVWAQRLASARKRLGLPALTDAQLRAYDPTAPVQCPVTGEWTPGIKNRTR